MLSQKSVIFGVFSPNNVLIFLCQFLLVGWAICVVSGSVACCEMSVGFRLPTVCAVAYICSFVPLSIVFLLIVKDRAVCKGVLRACTDGA